MSKNVVKLKNIACIMCEKELVYNSLYKSLECNSCGSIRPLAVTSKGVFSPKLAHFQKLSTFFCSRCENSFTHLDNHLMLCPLCHTSSLDISSDILIQPTSISNFGLDKNEVITRLKDHVDGIKFKRVILLNDDNALKKVFLPMLRFASINETFYSLTSHEKNSTKDLKLQDVSDLIYLPEKSFFYHKQIYVNITKQVRDIVLFEDFVDNITKNLLDIDKLNWHKFDETKTINENIITLTNNIDMFWLKSKELSQTSILENITMQLSKKKSLDLFDINYTDLTYQYCLIPVYVATYKIKKKTHVFYINGVTGKIASKTYLSIKERVAVGLLTTLYIIIGIGVLLLIFWLLSLLFK